ncbi:hypothetical protein [Portibacter marinus]|uniref:hypothetical protein n=1 Tax=Portibacter marinus TaxID=2898660 RepID=UPI001F1BEB87|nr:hypothetical protein [Portibacter marinus]
MDISLNSKDDRRAKIAAFIFALILLFLILYPFWSYTFPPPEKEGILVAFGEVEVVGGNDEEDNQQTESNVVEDGEKVEKKSEPLPENKPAEPKSQTKKEVVVSEVAKEKESEVVINEKVTAKSPSAEDLKKEEEAKRAAEEARKKAEYEKAKKQFGDLLGKGKGDGSSTGNAGDPQGDPNTDVLKGMSKGNGRIEGGLADRGLIFEPQINENSQKAGIVVVRVCVNNQGEVIESNYTQRGSTTTDSDLVSVAIEGAKKYRFSKSPIEKQCGTITIEFKLR